MTLRIETRTVYAVNGRDYGNYDDAVEATLPTLPAFLFSLYKNCNLSRIDLIKAMRDASNTCHGDTMGLKDAKDYIERAIGYIAE